MESGEGYWRLKLQKLEKGGRSVLSGAIKERSENIKQGIQNSRLGPSCILLQKRRLRNLSLPGLVIMFYLVKNRFYS